MSVLLDTSLTTAMPMPSPAEFGRLLRHIREKRRLSQRQLAAAALELGHRRALSAAYVSRLEAGERRLGIGAAAALSAVLPIRFNVERGTVWLVVPVPLVPDWWRG